MNDIILITGCARSGTSMTAGQIYLGGAWGGKLSGPNNHNLKGMFENQSIRNDLVKPFLRSIGCDPLGQDPLPKIGRLMDLPSSFFTDWRSKVEKIFRDQGYTEGPIFYKGAKMCLMWPIWHRAFPDARWIIVRRETEDIINSCLRTSFMRRYNRRSGWLRWVAEHERRFEQMADNKLNIQEVWPQRMVSGDFSEIQIVINNLGLKWDLKVSMDFVDPGLWRRWLARRERHGK